MSKPDFYCSDLARDQGASLIGTAPRVSVWFLLEYPHAWGVKALPESSLPAEVKAHLAAAQQILPHSQTLLIRQRESRDRSERRFFVAVTHEHDRRLYRFLLPDYSALLDLDLAAVARGEHPDALWGEPLALVCTHGRRDRCCARFGPAMESALREHLGPAVWGSSHISGHRFAPTLLFLPQGTLYGRATPDEAGRLLRALEADQVYPPLLRGRTCYPPHVQAAEHYLRLRTGETALDAFTLRAAQPLDDHTWRVTFRDRHGRDQTLTIRAEQSDFQTFITCRKDKQQRITWFYPQADTS